MLALSSMMLPQPQSLDENSSLYQYSQIIRDNTKQITKEIIGDEYIEFQNNDYRHYYPNVPQHLDKYVDYACMIIAELIDSVMASRFINEESLSILQDQLEQIEKIISQFNKEANHIHKISDITYIDKNNDNLKK